MSAPPPNGYIQHGDVVETKEKKYEEELAEDIMKILTCYSARFYGRRGGRKKEEKYG